MKLASISNQPVAKWLYYKYELTVLYLEEEVIQNNLPPFNDLKIFKYSNSLV